MPVYIVSHKEFQPPIAIPNNYQTIFVGPRSTELANKYLGLSDAFGDSIGELNDKFCELTAIYWIWKNVNTEYKGIVHYRRYFTDGPGAESAISEAKIFESLNKCDYIVPEKYWLLNEVGKHYASHHSSSDLDYVRESIAQLFPAYIESFDMCMKYRYVYPYNMLIARAGKFDEYCSWLFPILFETNSRIDYSDRSDYQTRAIGFLSERLLAVFLSKGHSTISEKYVVTTEKEIKRTISMSLAKFLYGNKH